MDSFQSTGNAPLRPVRRLLESGSVPPPPFLAPPLARSWERCLKAGLVPFARPYGGDPLPALRLREVVERRRALVRQARPVMEELYARVRGTGSMVILADDQGVVIEALGDPEFLRRAERVSLQAGACWHENDRGTNAIGTALAEGGAVVVHGPEHFFDCNRFLSCTAAPVRGSDGRVLGVLDISGPGQGRPPTLAGLVETAGRTLENALFAEHHASAWCLHLHPRVEGLGRLGEGLVAVNGAGQIVGANREAQALLGIPPEALGRIALESVLDTGLDALKDLTRRGGVARLAGRDGHSLFVQGQEGARRRQPSGKAVPPDALAALDTGDERLRLCLERARKVMDKGIPLLLHGESGVGKEKVAAAIHASGPRRDRALVAVNCAALPETLIEAELFGYAPGAFTGARREGAPGRLREAHGGTLFLDEIGDMPLALQARLLRVLQEREVVPLGGGKPIAVDFALIAASHRSLKQAVEQGRFRADLYYRLNGVTLTLPPLRERSDFPALVHRILEDLAPGAGVALEPDVANTLARYRWPGNLRQLFNVLRFACALLDPGERSIGWAHLPEDLIEDLGTGPAPDTSLRATADAVMARTVAECQGNLSEAARRLGVSRSTLYRRLKGGRGGEA
ncbi:sigma-54-dependent Fis family transcriptional regulator [Pararhodospirillum photometricum]|nr:sigma-54-dependent Fis family transcriptional regulator [Pararhodospirillum photometricum]